MPWLSDEIPDWEEMAEEEREELREVVRSLGMAFVLDEVEDDYCE